MVYLGTGLRPVASCIWANSRWAPVCRSWRAGAGLRGAPWIRPWRLLRNIHVSQSPRKPAPARLWQWAGGHGKSTGRRDPTV